MPYSTQPEKAKTFGEHLKTAANTAEMLDALGALPEVDAKTFADEKKFIAAVTGKDNKALENPLIAAGAASFLREYGSQLALDVAQVRSALTYKLLDLANYGDPKIELKAIEMLGKHVDIGLFTEKSEVTVRYENPEELQKQILLRVKRIMGAEITDEVPMIASLEAELGFKPIVEGEFTEVKDEDKEKDDE